MYSADESVLEDLLLFPASSDRAEAIERNGWLIRIFLFVCGDLTWHNLIFIPVSFSKFSICLCFVFLEPLTETTADILSVSISFGAPDDW